MALTNLVNRVRLMSTLPPASVLSCTLWDLIWVIEVFPVFLSTDTWYTLIRAFESAVEGAAGRWMLSSAWREMLVSWKRNNPSYLLQVPPGVSDLAGQLEIQHGVAGVERG